MFQLLTLCLQVDDSSYNYLTFDTFTDQLSGKLHVFDHAPTGVVYRASSSSTQFVGDVFDCAPTGVILP